MVCTTNTINKKNRKVVKFCFNDEPETSIASSMQNESKIKFALLVKILMQKTLTKEFAEFSIRDLAMNGIVGRLFPNLSPLHFLYLPEFV